MKTRADTYRYLCLISSGLLLVWYFFNATLSSYEWFSGLLENDRYAAYIVTVLIMFFYLEYLVELLSREADPTKLVVFRVVFTTLIAFGALLIAYPKLVAGTDLSDTTRIDLSVGIIMGTMAGVVAVSLRIAIETSLVFFRFRRKLLTSQILEISILFVLAIATIFAINISDKASLPIRHMVFAIIFLATFYLLAPKRKIFGDEEMHDLKRQHELLERQVEISEFLQQGDMGLPESLSPASKKLRKKALNLVKRPKTGVFYRVEVTNDLAFSPNGDYFSVVTDCIDMQTVLILKVLEKGTEKTLSSTEIKLKYVKDACKKVKKVNPGNDPRGFLTPMAVHAYKIQQVQEGDAEELAYRFSSDGNLKQLKALVKARNPDLNKHQSDGYTPLLIAVANGEYDVAEYLLQKAADTNSETKLGVTPIGFAAKYGDLRLCRLLISARCDINHRDLYGLTPLMLAAKNGHAAIVRYLLENGADKGIKCGEGKLAIDYAVERKNGTIRKMLADS